MSVTEGREAWIAVEMWWMDLLAVRAWMGELVGWGSGDGEWQAAGGRSGDVVEGGCERRV